MPSGDAEPDAGVEGSAGGPLTPQRLRGLLDLAAAERAETAASAFADALARPGGAPRIVAMLHAAGAADGGPGDDEPGLGLAVATLRAALNKSPAAAGAEPPAMLRDLLELAALRLPEPWGGRARAAQSGDRGGAMPETVAIHADAIADARAAAAGAAAAGLTGGGAEAGAAEGAPLRLVESSRLLVGRYRLESRLGAGGMGVVFRARHTDSGHLAAVKVLRLDAVLGERARRFREEARIVAALDHPAIVRVFDSGVDEGGGFPSPWIATELVDGVTFSEFAGRLRALRDRGTRRSKAWLSELLATFSTSCDAIAHAHERGVLHRDLKPQNVLVDAAGAPHVVDFGIAKLIDDSETNHTRSGLVLGTPGYMAPEVARGGAAAATYVSDVWALGAMLFEALSGTTPHDLAGLPPEQALRRMADAPVRRIASLWPGVPRDLAAVVAVATAAEPHRRYASAAALRDDIDRLRAGQPVTAREPALLEELTRLAARHRGPFVATAGLFLLLVVVGVATTWLWQRAAFAEAEHQRSAERARSTAASSFGALVTATRMAAELCEKTIESERIHELVSAPLAVLDDLRQTGEAAAAPRDWLQLETQLREILADMLMRTGRWREATPHRTRVLEIQRELATGIEPPTRDLARALVKVGDVMRQLDDDDEMRRCYEDAHEIYVARHLADPAMPHAADDLGWSLERLSFMASKIDADEQRAAQLAEERVRLARTDFERRPDYRSRHALAAAIVRYLEYRYRAEGRRTGELELVHEALAAIDEALREDPARRSLFLLKINGWCLLASEAVGLGLVRQAREALANATRLADDLRQSDPADHDYCVLALGAWSDWLRFAPELALDRELASRRIHGIACAFDRTAAADLVLAAAGYLRGAGFVERAEDLERRVR